MRERKEKEKMEGERESGREREIGLSLSISLEASRKMFGIIFLENCKMGGSEVIFKYQHHHHHYLHHHRHHRQVHHEWTAPIALATDYCHPLEHALVNVLPNIAYAIVIGSD